MNIWHDIDPALITPERFMAVIEIKRGGKNKYELDKATACSALTAFCTLQRIIRRIMVLFRAPMLMTGIRWMFLFFARRLLSL